MKYAHEILALMRPYPGTEFRMAQLVREATGGRTLAPRENEAVRKGVRRVLAQLIDSGQVERVGGTLNRSPTPGADWDMKFAKTRAYWERSVGQYGRGLAP